MDRIFQKLMDDDLSDLAGLEVAASIPVPEHLLNEIISSALNGNHDISYCHVKVNPENRITVDVKSPRLPWQFTLKLRLFRTVDFTHSPTIRAFLDNNLLLGKLGAFLKLVPDGIKIYDDQVSVDIGSFIRDPMQRMLLGLIKALEIGTESGKVILDVKVER
jgi:hypothetical protein